MFSVYVYCFRLLFSAGPPASSKTSNSSQTTIPIDVDWSSRPFHLWLLTCNASSVVPKTTCGAPRVSVCAQRDKRMCVRPPSFEGRPRETSLGTRVFVWCFFVLYHNSWISAGFRHRPSAACMLWPPSASVCIRADMSVVRHFGFCFHKRLWPSFIGCKRFLINVYFS